MQPYQEAGAQIQNQRQRPMEYLKKGAAIGTSVLAGGAALKRIMPLLSPLIPENLAIKGLSKVNPRIGKFLTGATKDGTPASEALEFLREKFKPEEEPPKENGNIIQQVSPELHQFIDQEIRKGRKPLEAGTVARLDKKHAETIKKLEKQHKTPWSQIIESLYGNGDQALPQQGQQGQQQAPAPQQGQQAQGQGLDPGVAAILKQGQSILQKFGGGL